MGNKVILHAAPKDEAHAAAVFAEAERLRRNAANRYNHQYDMLFNNCSDFAGWCFNSTGLRPHGQRA